MAVTMKKIVFGYVIPCSLVEFQGPEDGGNRFLQNIGNFYQITHCHIQDVSIVRSHCCENLKCH
jgi:hypothetical protein